MCMLVCMMDSVSTKTYNSTLTEMRQMLVTGSVADEKIHTE